MSWTNRLIGFGICSGLAALFIVLVSYYVVVSKQPVCTCLGYMYNT